MKTQRLAFSLIGLALLAGTPAAWAQGGTYDVSHDFRFTSPGSDTARVTVYDFRHAWIVTNGNGDEDHTPLAQNPGFDPYGTDGFGANNGVFNSGLFGSTVPVLFNSGQIQPTGAPGTPFCVTVSLPPSFATACNAVRVDPWTNAAPIDITGRINSSGVADAGVFGQGAAIAYAFSTAGIRIDGGVTLANGTIRWTPGALVDMVGGGAGDIAVKDPVVITAINPNTGDTVEHTLVDIDMTHDGIGHVDINGSTLHVNIPEFTIDVVIDPAVIAPGQAGELHLEVDNGVLVSASGTGLYAGSVPPLGINIPFDVPMPPIVLDYDLNLDQTQPWEVTAEMGGGGDALSDAAGACPADLTGDGILDLEDINAFILGFVEMLPQSDLNGDGIWDLEDIGLFIESFTSGCP
jgi:hypothetical protein